MAFRTVGIWQNYAKPGVQEVAWRLRAALEAKGMRVLTDCAHLDDCDLMMVLGGDGTFLHAFEAALPRDIPILGVNLGRVGFLSEIQPSHLEDDVELLAAGDTSSNPACCCRSARPPPKGVCAERGGIQRSDRPWAFFAVGFRERGVVDRFSGDGDRGHAYGFHRILNCEGGPILVRPGLFACCSRPSAPIRSAARPIVISDKHVIAVSILGDKRRARIIVDGTSDRAGRWQHRAPCRSEHPLRSAQAA
jgi:NAD+ kinase